MFLVVVWFLLVPYSFCLRPNIVIIVADDMGWNDVGFHSGDVPTPNIDALAYNGVILGHHYSQPVCSPSRTALLTGNYPFRYGMQGKPCIAGHPDGLKIGVKLMPEHFNRLGYKSHLVGKWHLGYQTEHHLPTRRGFDSFFGYLNGFLGYWDATHYTQGVAGRDFRRDEKGAWPEAYGKYLTDLLTDEAVRIISDHKEVDGLLLMVMEGAVHATNLPMSKEAPPGVTNVTGRGYLRAMAKKLDDSVGEIISALDRRGVLNNSIIVFISDNGGLPESPVNQNYASNWPLRGEKKSVHEGGVRTVATIWSPLIKVRSRVSHGLFHITDWFPTLYAAAGGYPEELELLDGIDQWSSISGGKPEVRKRLVVDIDDINGCEAFIDGRWKLVKNHHSTSTLKFTDNYYGENGSWMAYNRSEVERSRVASVLSGLPSDFLQLRRNVSITQVCPAPESHICDYCLFDIFEDPTECYDMSSRRPEVVAKLKTILENYRKSVVPNTKKDFDKRGSPNFSNDYWSPWLTE